MSEVDERLIVMLEARIAEFERRMMQAERRGTSTYHGLRRGSQSATRQMERDMALASARINMSLASITTGVGKLAGAFGIGLGIGALSGLAGAARGAVRDMADLADAADRVGLDVEDFQGLRIGLGLSGVAADEASSSLEKFAQRLGDAASGQGDLFKTLEKSGVSIRTQSGEMRATLDIMKDYADVVAGAPNAAERMALVTDAFGRGGKAMVLAMSEGAAGIDDMIGKARESGVVIDEEMIRKAAELDDKFDMIGARIESAFKRGVVGAGEMFGLIEQHREAMEFAPDMAERVVGEALTNELSALPEVGNDARAVIEGLVVEYAELAEEARTLVPALSDASNMLRGLGNEAGAIELTGLAMKMQEASRAFEDGTITGEEFAAKLVEVAMEANATIAEMSEMDQMRLGGITGAVAGLLEWIGLLPGAVAAARAEIATLEGVGIASPMDTGTGLSSGDVAGLMPPGTGSVDTSPRPPRAPPMLGEGGGGAGGGSRGGGGGGGGSRGGGRIEALLADLQTEREVLTEWYEESLTLLNSATEAQLAAVGGKHEALERLEAEHAERMGQIRELSNSGALATVTAAGGDRMVKASRIFGAAEALINVGRAQAQVLADPKLGFWAKLPAVAAIGAAGMKLVSAIKGGGSSGGGGGGGGSGGSSASAQAGRASEGPLLVRFEGLDDDSLYSGKSIRRFYDAMTKEAGDRGAKFVGAGG